jgi:hypothetical protein
LLLFLWLFYKVFNRLINNLLSQQAKREKFDGLLLDALTEFRESCIRCSSASVAAAARAREETIDWAIATIRSEVDRAIANAQRETDIQRDESRPIRVPASLQPYPPAKGALPRKL